MPAGVLVTARWLLAVVAPGAALALTLLVRPLLGQAPGPPFIHWPAQLNATSPSIT